ncbi:MAG: nucleoside triphosphate pyrophosphohydrolase [Holophagales bacterium]|nr:nucleoside triphosphate pyrophosphohydrolase [Holophagales bacterium]MYF05250.1 nucleoside triphosphate pyrophosphohydrolase [Holophagales bacterium]MYJ23956.1 nucleoside triphosphate pyrophosphohydrolase [Holophagales bacterium]
MQDRNKGDGAGHDSCSLAPIADLIDRLRVDCPWDRELSLADLRAYLIEEAHELAAAIDERDPAAINEELGDLLFEAVYVARLTGAELGDLPLSGAIRTVIDKMVARHPHVFGDEKDQAEAGSAAEVAAKWEQRKRSPDGERSVLDGVPASLPALVGAYRLGQKAAGIGFDWDSTKAVRAKVAEELGELDHETANDQAGRSGEAKARVEEELGDVLFAVANLARHLDVDPERALAAANRKFRRRFAAMEAELKPGGDYPLEELERLWERVKLRVGPARRASP